METKDTFTPPDRKSLLIGVLLSSLFFLLVLSLVLLWRLPNTIGELAGIISGFLLTPFFLESSVAVLGFILLITINYVRNKREGNECVYLDEIHDAAAKEGKGR